MLDVIPNDFRGQKNSGSMRQTVRLNKERAAQRYTASVARLFKGVDRFLFNCSNDIEFQQELDQRRTSMVQSKLRTQKFLSLHQSKAVYSCSNLVFKLRTYPNVDVVLQLAVQPLTQAGPR